MLETYELRDLLTGVAYHTCAHTAFHMISFEIYDFDIILFQIYWDIYVLIIIPVKRFDKVIAIAKKIKWLRYQSSRVAYSVSLK